MSKYTCYYSTRKEMYRDMAVRWKRWADTVELSEQELRGVSKFFNDIAIRFGLISEFKEIGVI